MINDIQQRNMEGWQWSGNHPAKETTGLILASLGPLFSLCYLGQWSEIEIKSHLCSLHLEHLTFMYGAVTFFFSFSFSFSLFLFGWKVGDWLLIHEISTWDEAKYENQHLWLGMANACNHGPYLYKDHAEAKDPSNLVSPGHTLVQPQP